MDFFPGIVKTIYNAEIHLHLKDFCCRLCKTIFKNTQKCRTDALSYSHVQYSFSSHIYLSECRGRVKVEIIIVMIPFL